MQEIHSKLLTYAYNIVGSYEDAKDVVQDVTLKYLTIDKKNIRNEANFLIKSVVNQAINFKNKHRKKENFGEWLPEPVSFDNAETQLVKEQTLNYTLLVLLENLGPKERAVFILKEGFSYSHKEIAELLDITTENSRQILRRSSKELKKLNRDLDGFALNNHTETIQKYQTALSEINIQALENLLVEDIRLTADKGQKIQVVKAVETGKNATATLLTYVWQRFLTGKKHSFHTFNHRPAICFWQDGRVYNCHIFQLDPIGKIQQIFSIVDPKKLKNIF
ncbi:sigma-70 family RNA polymerase sigma factor [Negadavirga shengliensis]|uniref:Sigma-70 family RNA polymerase sigma factor n=1 Tax=Negadavirga shengliensis TaxID=1389218 RepID=A0ABV9T1S0_9BACT